MIENFLMGAGCKFIGNIATHWLENSAEERKYNAIRDAEQIKAHMELVKESNKHLISSISRAVIFTTLTATWCYMGIAGLAMQGMDSTVLIPSEAGFFAKLFNHQTLKPIDIKGTTLLYQWWQIMEMIMGAFVMPSRKNA